jgi:hypothetical protein
VSTAQLTVTGRDAGADHIAMRCQHGETTLPLDPPANDDRLTGALDDVMLRHRVHRECSCDRLVALLDGTDGPVQ